MFSGLIFSVNFGKMTEILPAPAPPAYRVNYVLFDYNSVSPPVADYIVLASRTASIDLSLPASFYPMPLCDPTLLQKYQVGKTYCVAITSCSLASLNANYCMDENKALSCINNFNMSTTQTCIAGCDTNTPRSPGSITTNAICNYDCSLGNVLCPTANQTDATDLATKYQCPVGATRINYKCMNITNNSS